MKNKSKQAGKPASRAQHTRWPFIRQLSRLQLTHCSGLAQTEPSGFIPHMAAVEGSASVGYISLARLQFGLKSISIRNFHWNKLNFQHEKSLQKWKIIKSSRYLLCNRLTPHCSSCNRLILHHRLTLHYSSCNRLTLYHSSCNRLTLYHSSCNRLTLHYSSCQVLQNQVIKSVLIFCVIWGGGEKIKYIFMLPCIHRQKSWVQRHCQVLGWRQRMSEKQGTDGQG